MDKRAIKDLTYGGLSEILKDRNNYYYSSVSSEYSHLTEEGEKLVIEYINMLSHKIMRADEEDLDWRAKELTMKALKGETV
jgi:hypothetical protein